MRPLPILPRGPRRRAVAPREVLLACPRVCPDWELAALRALMKPQLKDRILHRKPMQHWPKDAEQRVAFARAVCRDRIGYDPDLHLPADGDYFLAARVEAAAIEDARGLVLLLSRQFPATWFVLGRLFVRDGQFFRRSRRVRLGLVPASDVHLSRGMRAALRDVLSSRAVPCTTSR